MKRIAVHRSARTYLDAGGRPVLTDWTHAFRPIAASETARGVAGVESETLTIRVAASAPPEVWILAPIGARLVEDRGAILLCTTPQRILDAREAVYRALEGRDGLGIEFAPGAGVGDG